MRVERAEAADAPAWDAFVEAHPEATPYHRFVWRLVAEQELGHRSCYLLARQGADVCGVLPLCEVRFGPKRWLVSVPGGCYGAPLAHDSATVDALGDAAADLAMERHASHVELRSFMPAPRGYDTRTPNVRARTPITSADPEALLRTVVKGARRELRIAQGNALELERDTSVDAFYDTYLDSSRRLGSPPYGRAFFAAIARHFGSDAEVLVARSNGIACASELWLRCGRTWFSAFKGTAARGRELRAGYALHWDKLCRAAAEGCVALDLGRSHRDSPSLTFKKAWKPVIEPVHFHTRSIDGRRHDPPNPESFSMRQARAAWRRLPRALSRRLGPHIVRWIH